MTGDLTGRTNRLTVKAAEIGQPGDISVVLWYREFRDSVPPFFVRPADRAVFVSPKVHRLFRIMFSIKWS